MLHATQHMREAGMFSLSLCALQCHTRCEFSAVFGFLVDITMIVMTHMLFCSFACVSDWLRYCQIRKVIARSKQGWASFQVHPAKNI